MSRQKFIGLVLSGATAGALGLAFYKEAVDRNRGDNRSQFERDQMGLFDQRIKQGINSGWLEAVVWPGLAILPSDVELFSTAPLLKGSEIEWPKGERAEHLAVQRPFLINQSAALNQEPLTYNPENGNDVVLGFWLPGSQQLAFFDETKYSEQILLPTHSQAPIYTGDYTDIVGEQVSLELPVTLRGLTYRYIDAKYVQDNYVGDSGIQKKVLGRSKWVDIGQVAENYYAFQTGQGSDLVQLPEAG